MGNNYDVYIDKGDNNENDDNNKMRKRHFIGVSGGNASNRIYDEMIILKIKVSKCDKDRDNNYESNNVVNNSKLINRSL